MTVSEAPLAPFSEAIDGVDSALLVVSASGEVLASNRAFEERFGTAPENVAALALSTGLVEGSHPDLVALAAEGTAASGTLGVRGIKGSITRAAFSLTPIGGETTSGCLILALEPMAADTVAPNPLVEELIEGAPCIVWVADPEGALTLTNDRWPRTLGAPPARTDSILAAAAIHPDDYERCRASWESALRTGGLYEVSARHRVADESYRRFLTRAVPLTSEAGELLGWLGTTTDVDEPAGQRAIEGAAAETGASERLLATASHEIRGPLAVIQGTVQLARRRASNRALTSEDVAVALEQIGEQTERALRLVEQLLDHSRVSMGRLVLQAVPTDVTVLAQNVVTAITGATDSHEIVIRAPQPCIAEVDGPRIEQVLFNLIENAMKFSRAGSRIDVTVSAMERDGVDVVEIAVRDRGRGVPRAERALIFERFHQVAGDDAERGLGIGLSVSKEIVELHQGTMSVGTPRGGGTRFLVQLPVRQPAAADADDLDNADDPSSEVAAALAARGATSTSD